MNNNWKSIYHLLQKEERIIVGLMSGTSLDGLDIALCKVSGQGLNTDVKVLKFTTTPYEEAFKAEVKQIFSKKLVDLQLLTLMNEEVGLLHAQLVLRALENWGITPKEVDVIASHGQTIFHAPKSLHQMEGFPNATLQIGDGDHIAVHTGILTIADFRQKHLAAGGEGAPLAVYGDYLLFSKLGEIRIMLNIGGIANLTYLPGDHHAAGIFSTDVGPGNTIMDQFIQANYIGLSYDKDGEIALKGDISSDLLDELLKLDFLSAAFPKTTGPELFNLAYLEAAQRNSNTGNLRNEDVMATLNKLTATVIVAAISQCIGNRKDVVIYFSGGGIHNKLLISHLESDLPQVKFENTNELGIDPDAKEAVLFAVLANETLMGEPVNFGEGLTTVAACMGKICLPH